MPIICFFHVFIPIYACFAMAYPMMLSYLPLLIHSIYLRRIKGRGEVEKKGLDLSIESNSSDWSGRVLDIVKRVNKQTSSESSKTNEKIKHLTEDVNSLKK